MLNPSTADGRRDDPTIRRCVSFANREGCNELVVVNLFALRATDPSELKTHPAPVGAGNDGAILQAVRDADLVIAAWGAHGALGGRARHVLRLLGAHNLFCLGATADGHPRHPVRLHGDTPLTEYPPA